MPVSNPADTLDALIIDVDIERAGGMRLVETPQRERMFERHFAPCGHDPIISHARAPGAGAPRHSRLSRWSSGIPRTEIHRRARAGYQGA